MKAVVYSRYGSPDVLELTNIEKPVPKGDEVLIHVHATSVTSGDWRARSLNVPPGFGLLARLVFGLMGPRQPILGTELAGVIDAIGDDVTTLKVGDEVFAFTGAAMGCHTEYKCLRASGAVALKPANITHQEAAAISFGGTTALGFLRRAEIKRGNTVLVNGASGGVGTAAVQIARHFGADVTGVCSTVNVDLVRSLGASEVIDYTKEDFTQNGKVYDIIFDTVGTAPFSRSKRSLSEGGRLVLVLASLSDLVLSPFAAMSGKRVIAGPAGVRDDDLQALATMAETGALKIVIDETFPVERVADAHRRVDSGRKRGNVVVTL